MTVPSREEIQSLLLELCSEDDWGSWELWWNVSSKVQGRKIEDLKVAFLDLLSSMVAARKLIPKHRDSRGRFEETTYDRDKLSEEIDAAGSPDPDSFFWFGIEEPER